MRAEAPVPSEVLSAIRRPLAEAGAVMLDVPVLQPLALLLDLAGEAMRPRLFVVQSEGGEEAALRPDFTIPVARAHIADGARAGRYAYEGKAFRAAGATPRAEEFLQMGLESYGDADPVAAEIQMVVLAWKAALAGGRSDLELVLGDVSLFAALIDDLALAPALTARLKRAFGRPRLLLAELDTEAPNKAAPESRLAGLLAGLPEAEAVILLEEVWALAGVSPVGGRPALEIARRLAARHDEGASARLSRLESAQVQRFLAIQGPLPAALDNLEALGGPRLSTSLALWRQRLALLAAAGVPVSEARFEAGFGRAFSYYDGPLFEVRSQTLGEDRPLAAGGRYDLLIPRLGGQAVGAVGCMVRPARAFAGSGE
ncbi:MAG: ATP phosphoribosyltransferase regulatory subunit [Caulobacter sp.]|nr:ATP phosphoribosyltransferase regulatory subunit [Caulobacter sp.]